MSPSSALALTWKQVTRKPKQAESFCSPSLRNPQHADLSWVRPKSPTDESGDRADTFALGMLAQEQLLEDTATAPPACRN